MKTVKKICLYCTNEFNASVKELARGNAKFCCISCSRKFHDNLSKVKAQIELICETCGKTFYRRKSGLNGKHNKYFCTVKCKNIGQKIGNVKEIQPKHYDSGQSIKYRKKAFNAHEHKCSCCNYNKHTDVLEVHHRDGNRKNNKLNNLIILCPRCHREYHLGYVTL